MISKNPVLQRELRGALRGGKPFLLMAAYVAVLAGVIAFTYPRNLKFDPTTSTLGRNLFLTFSAVQLLLVLIVTPAIAVASLATEREQGALESMLVTPLTRWQIILGKFFASLFHVTLLVLASLPLTAVTFMLGGVSPAELVCAYVLILSVAAVAAGIGLLHASAAPSSLLAMANAYLSLPFYALAFAALWFVGLTGVALLFMETLFAYAYFMSRRQAVRTAAYGAMGVCCFSFVPLLTGRWSLATTYHLTFGLAALGAAFPLATFSLASAQRQLKFATARQSRWNENSVVMRINSVLRRPPRRFESRCMIADGINPVLVMEWRRIHWGKWLVAFVACTAAYLIFAWHAVTTWHGRTWTGPPPSHWLSPAVQWHLLTLMVCSGTLGAVSVAREFELRAMEHICTTLLTRTGIMAAKLVVALCTPLMMISAIVPGLMLASRHGLTSQEFVWLYVVLCAVSILTLTAVGMLCATYWTRMRSAIIASVSLVAVLAVHRMVYYPSGMNFIELLYDMARHPRALIKLINPFVETEWLLRMAWNPYESMLILVPLLALGMVSWTIATVRFVPNPRGSGAR